MLPDRPTKLKNKYVFYKDGRVLNSFVQPNMGKITDSIFIHQISGIDKALLKRRIPENLKDIINLE